MCAPLSCRTAWVMVWGPQPRSGALGPFVRRFSISQRTRTLRAAQFRWLLALGSVNPQISFLKFNESSDGSLFSCRTNSPSALENLQASHEGHFCIPLTDYPVNPRGVHGTLVLSQHSDMHTRVLRHTISENSAHKPPSSHTKNHPQGQIPCKAPDKVSGITHRTV